MLFKTKYSLDGPQMHLFSGVYYCFWQLQKEDIACPPPEPPFLVLAEKGHSSFELSIIWFAPLSSRHLLIFILLAERVKVNTIR